MKFILKIINALKCRTLGQATQLFFLLALLLSLSGCASNTSKNTSIFLNLQAVNKLNPDLASRPSPVVVTVYQLQTTDAFKKGSFYSLYADASKTLGAALVDNYETEVRPSQNLIVPLTIWPKTRYIGIIAAYRNLNTWRVTLPTEGLKNNMRLNILLGSQGVSAKFARK